jgi:trk system potassium uptake protein TrkH
MAPLRRSIQHPARLVPLGFLIAIAIGTLLLMLPVARADGTGAPFLVALFTSVSAVCVTGLIVVDTPTYWSGFGQGVILLLFQIGGLGIMTGAALLTLLVTRRLGIGSRLIAQAETKSAGLGDVSGLLRLILIVTIGMEVAVALFLQTWLHYAHGVPPGEAAWHAVFQSVSAFNNAGFSTYSDSLIGFARDPFVLLPLMLAVVIGGLGMPVLFELSRRRASGWSVHTRITLLGTALLLVLGVVGTAAFEWNAALGHLDWGDKLLNAASHSVMSRTAGFNSIDVGAMSTESLLLTYALMFIGGGSAGTAGGIKVTTFFLLGFVVWAEIRGQRDTNVYGRRISTATQRQALTIVLLSTAAVVIGTMIVAATSDFTLERVAFEVISAFATVGLSTGITADLSPVGQYTLIALMFAGRVGTITIATALALRERAIPYSYPEERPIVG